ncbi:MAG: hypothetical protein LBH32_13195 [Dysgonamonadaceae bacterium]|jgi:hypothetical protein|nr:hypothetical protein [Dysgonamonadaceae bacterium]
MKKTVVLFLALFILFITQNQTVMAQDESISNKVFYMELGGPGVVMSANFDGRFIPGKRLGLGYRVGAGFGIGEFDGQWIPKSSTDYYGNEVNNGYYERETHTYYSIPVLVNYLFGREDNAAMFEVGAGATFLTRKVSIYNYDGNEKYGNFIGNINFMLRLQPVNTGLVFRVGFTPIIGTAGDLFPMGSLSLGYTF